MRAHRVQYSPPAPVAPLLRGKMPPRADVAQLVERQLPKLEVAGSKPVVRSNGRHQVIDSRSATRCFFAFSCICAMTEGPTRHRDNPSPHYLMPEAYLPLILRISHLAGS